MCHSKTKIIWKEIRDLNLNYYKKKKINLCDLGKYLNPTSKAWSIKFKKYINY